MKHTTLIALFAIVSSVALNAEPPDKPMPVTSRISAVTIYADRARVTRAASVTLKKGTTSLSVVKLPGWLDKGSLRVKLSPADGSRITDVHAKKEYLAEASDADLRRAEASVIEISDQLMGLDDELAILEAEKKQIENTRAFSMEKLPKDMLARDTKVTDYSEVVAYISKALRTNAAARRNTMSQRRKLQPEMSARQKKLNDLRKLAHLEESTIFITIESKSQRVASLDLTYMLPGATWEPTHELRAATKSPSTVSVTSYAVIRQTTGEDWEGATIHFSTQSPSDLIEIPELDALLLGKAGQARQVINDAYQSFQVAQQAYSAGNAAWNGKYSVNNSDYAANWKQQVSAQSRISEIFKTLRKRGTTALFEGNTKPLVRSDGEPVRLQIGTAHLKSSPRIIAAPQVSLNATRTVDMVNTSKQPLLPGTVALYQEGAFLGQTDIDFTADGETFSVALGMADHVKLSRALDKSFSSLARGQRTRMMIAFETTVENLASTGTIVELADRIPVSERKEIEIDKIRITPSAEPDTRGIIKWTLSLKAGEKRVLRTEYRLEYPRAVIQRASKSKRILNRPAASVDYMLIDLEASF
jgi:uncharacterized protein (TIGR02231 family)